MLANGTGTAVTKQGGKTWYMIYPNYAFGQNLERQMRAAVEKNGGKLAAPSEATPFPNTDFSSYLLKAQSLKPQVLGTMQAGADLVNVVKQYNEFMLKDKGITLSVGLMFITDIHSLGPDAFANVAIAGIRHHRTVQRLQLDRLAAMNREHLASSGPEPSLEARIDSFELAFRMQSELPKVEDLSGETDATSTRRSVRS